MSVRGLIFIVVIAATIIYLFPSLSKSLRTNARPGIKTTLRTALMLREQAKEMFAEASEQWADLIAEVEHERSTERDVVATTEAAD